MAIIKKWAFHRLLDSLTADQYEAVIATLRNSELSWPGWTDRLSPGLEEAEPNEPARVHLPLAHLTRAVALAKMGTKADFTGDIKGGIWVQPFHDAVRISGSNDFTAAYSDVQATVDVPGTVAVNGRELWQITEALRKGLSRSAQRDAVATLETEGEDRIRVSVGGRSHLAALIAKSIKEPEFPPRADAAVRIHSAAAFQRAVLFAAATAGWNDSGNQPLVRDQVGLRADDGRLILDAIDRYSYAQAAIPVRHDAPFSSSLDHRWLREIAGIGIGGEIHLGETTSATGKRVFMIGGDHWAAWTDCVNPWQAKHTVQPGKVHTSVTFQVKEVLSYLIEAKRLSESTSSARCIGSIRAHITKHTFTLTSTNGLEQANTGSVHVPAQSDAGEPVTTYLTITGFHNALRQFSEAEVTLHVTESMVAYITTAGCMTGNIPPALWAMTTAKPPQAAP
ncbi:hypothetical protein [Paenarthrobacter nitroguajacolicus]|uniref:hypothetical protein n=1 Tax=Paenarthrobacter nitroguajacolicus TaxID=211146 RepID=UPI00405408C3